MQTQRLVLVIVLPVKNKVFYPTKPKKRSCLFQGQLPALKF
jgi:hypothetical protein